MFVKALSPAWVCMKALGRGGFALIARYFAKLHVCFPFSVFCGVCPLVSTVSQSPTKHLQAEKNPESLSHYFSGN